MDSGFVLKQIFGLTVLVLLFFQLYGSYFLLVSRLYSGKNRFLFLMLIWLVPVFGCFYVLYRLSPDELEFRQMTHLSQMDSEIKQQVVEEKNHVRDADTVL